MRKKKMRLSVACHREREGIGTAAPSRSCAALPRRRTSRWHLHRSSSPSKLSLSFTNDSEALFEPPSSPLPTASPSRPWFRSAFSPFDHHRLQSTILLSDQHRSGTLGVRSNLQQKTPEPSTTTFASNSTTPSDFGVLAPSTSVQPTS
ncbi:hypothetical protein PIB30_054071 [Stylosanthes scabra]|uniref:Uncharacterized protein n=1 Tax=Stylosanthes scabra TaxID=79078 RepID=A0ABU6WGZ5_9FABA|nr:hypothetical protein [Stylosanthes scabra]